MEAYQIIKAEDPERYGFVHDKNLLLLQIEEDNTMSVIETKNNNRAKGRCKVLFEGDVEDFCSEYKGCFEYGQLDVEIAFRNFLRKYLLNQ